MSLSPPSPTLPGGTTAPMITAPMITAPMLTAPMTSAGANTLSGPVSTAGSPSPSTSVPSAPPPIAVFTPEKMTSTLQQLVTAVQGLHLNQYNQYMAGPYAPPPAAPFPAYGHPAPWLFSGAPACGGPPLLPFQAGYPSGPSPAAASLWPLQPTPSAGPGWPLQPPPSPAAHGHLLPPFTATAGAPAQHPPPTLPLPAPPLPSSGASSSVSLPIHQVRFPPSLSPLPAWAAGSLPSPVYTTAPEQPTPFPQFGGPSVSAGHYPDYSDQAPPASLFRTSEPARHGAPTQAPPRYAKLDFAILPVL